MLNLLDGSDEEREKQANTILSVVEDVKRWSIFESAKKMGISYGPSDLVFTDFLLFEAIGNQRGK